MDKETLGTYGSVIVALILIVLLLLSVTPLLDYTKEEMNKLPDEIIGADELGNIKDIIPTKLATPTNLHLSANNVFSFDPVSRASGYEIVFKHSKGVYSVKTTSTGIDVSDILPTLEGYATIEVIATTNDIQYCDSDAAVYVVSDADPKPEVLTQ